MSISKSRENCSTVVSIVANRMPLGLMLDRRTWLSFFQEIEPPMGEMSGGKGAVGCVPKMEEIAGAPVIIEVCLGWGEDHVDLMEAGWIVAWHGLLKK